MQQAQEEQLLQNCRSTEHPNPSLIHTLERQNNHSTQKTPTPTHPHIHTHVHGYTQGVCVCVCVCVCERERERERERDSGIHTWGWESGRWGPGAQGTMRWRRVRQRWVPQCCGCALHSGSRWVCHRPAPVPPWLAFSTLSHHILHSFHLLSLSLSLNSPHLYLFSFSFSCSRAWSCCRRLL